MVNSSPASGGRLFAPLPFVRLICEHPTPRGQEGQPVVFDVEPGEVDAKIAQLKALGWKSITTFNFTKSNQQQCQKPTQFKLLLNLLKSLRGAG